MVFVSHSSSLPGTWLVPLLPTSGAEKSTWEGRLGAAAEQTKEAPLGLQARDRILQHTTGGRDELSPQLSKWLPATGHREGRASSSPGHVIVDVDFTEILLGFRVVKAHCPHAAAQQELE